MPSFLLRAGFLEEGAVNGDRKAAGQLAKEAGPLTQRPKVKKKRSWTPKTVGTAEVGKRGLETEPWVGISPGQGGPSDSRAVVDEGLGARHVGREARQQVIQPWW